MLYTCLVICLFSYKLFISCSISLISFFELRAKSLRSKELGFAVGSAVLLVSNCGKNVNKLQTLFAK